MDVVSSSSLRDGRHQAAAGRSRDAHPRTPLWFRRKAPASDQVGDWAAAVLLRPNRDMADRV